MKPSRFALALSIAASLAACKSNLEKCNEACTKIDDERAADCPSSGPERDSCLALVHETTASCHSLCEQAVGDGKASERASEPEKSLEDSCNEGKGRDCMDLAAKHLKGRGVDKSDALAAKYLDKACEHGEAVGCEMFAKMLRDGRGAAADPERARKLFAKACDAGAFGACTSLGLEAMESDKTKGVAFLTKACGGDDALGCMGLGALYLHGNGVPKDLPKARSLLDKSCRLGQESACEKVRELGG
jgi:hypothetical protein